MTKRARNMSDKPKPFAVRRANLCRFLSTVLHASKDAPFDAPLTQANFKKMNQYLVEPTEDANSFRMTVRTVSFTHPLTHPHGFTRQLTSTQVEHQAGPDILVLPDVLLNQMSAIASSAIQYKLGDTTSTEIVPLDGSVDLPDVTDVNLLFEYLPLGGGGGGGVHTTSDDTALVLQPPQSPSILFASRQDLENFGAGLLQSSARKVQDDIMAALNLRDNVLREQGQSMHARFDKVRSPTPKLPLTRRVLNTGAVPPGGRTWGRQSSHGQCKSGYGHIQLKRPLERHGRAKPGETREKQAAA